MGCWNGTCAISKLPIFNGDRVICWFFNSQRYAERQERPSAGNYSYSNGKYQLLGVPFRAKYNDYGSFEDIDEADVDMVEWMRRYIASDLVELEVGENKYHDIAVTKDKLDIELIKEAIHEERLFITGWGDNVSAIGVMMVHEHLFEHMVENTRWSKYTWPNGYNEKAVKLVQQFEPQKMIELMTDTVLKGKKQIAEEYYWSKPPEFDRYVRDITYADRMIDSLIRNEVEVTDSRFQKLFKGLAYNSMFMSMVDEMRIAIGPQCGSGSQQGDYFQYDALIAAMQSTMAKRKAQWEDETGEEYDE